MRHPEVTVMDAVYAVVLLESSVEGGSWDVISWNFFPTLFFVSHNVILHLPFIIWQIKLFLNSYLQLLLFLLGWNRTTKCGSANQNKIQVLYLKNHKKYL